jgi:hypothetical protein
MTHDIKNEGKTSFEGHWYGSQTGRTINDVYVY